MVLTAAASRLARLAVARLTHRIARTEQGGRDTPTKAVIASRRLNDSL